MVPQNMLYSSGSHAEVQRSQSLVLTRTMVAGHLATCVGNIHVLGVATRIVDVRQHIRLRTDVSGMSDEGDLRIKCGFSRRRLPFCAALAGASTVLLLRVRVCVGSCRNR